MEWKKYDSRFIAISLVTVMKYFFWNKTVHKEFVFMFKAPKNDGWEISIMKVFLFAINCNYEGTVVNIRTLRNYDKN